MIAKFIQKWIIPTNDKLGHFYLWGLLYFLCKVIWGKEIALVITIVSAFLKEVVHDGILKKGNVEVKDVFFSSLIPILDLIIE